MRVKYTMIDDVSLSSTIETIAGSARAIIPLLREAKSEGLDAKQVGVLNEKVTEIQDTLLVAQNDALHAQQVQSKQSARIRELEQTIKEFEDWESERARYTLVDAGQVGGVFVYSATPSPTMFLRSALTARYHITYAPTTENSTNIVVGNTSYLQRFPSESPDTGAICVRRDLVQAKSPDRLSDWTAHMDCSPSLPSHHPPIARHASSKSPIRLSG